MAARGRPPSPALLDALKLVKEGFPVFAAARASSIQPSSVFRVLARYKQTFPDPPACADAALSHYAAVTILL